MDKNNIIGILLIFALFIVWQQIMTPSPEEIEKQQRIRDSLAMVEQRANATESIQEPQPQVDIASSLANASDTLKKAQLGGIFGPFAPAASGEEKTEVLENDLF